MSWYWHGTKRQKTGQWTLDRTVDSGTGHQRRTPDMDTGQESGQWDRTPEADTGHGHWTGQWTVGPDTRGGHRTLDTGQDSGQWTVDSGTGHQRRTPDKDTGYRTGPGQDTGQNNRTSHNGHEQIKCRNIGQGTSQIARDNAYHTLHWTTDNGQTNCAEQNVQI